MAALEAAEGEGGDVRGRQSAALLVVPPTGEAWRRAIDLRVEDHEDPLAELRRAARPPARLRARGPRRRAAGRRPARRGRRALPPRRRARAGLRRAAVLVRARARARGRPRRRRRRRPQAIAESTRAGRRCSTACRPEFAPAGAQVRRRSVESATDHLQVERHGGRRRSRCDDLRRRRTGRAARLHGQRLRRGADRGRRVRALRHVAVEGHRVASPAARCGRTAVGPQRAAVGHDGERRSPAAAKSARVLAVELVGVEARDCPSRSS